MAYTAIDDAGSFFNVNLYTGTGSSLGVTGVGFQPDFTWIKQRNGTSNHYLADAVRGAGKYVESSTTIAEVTNVNGLSAFDADGFTVGTQGAQVNGSSDTYASWNWKAGTTSGIATNGSTTITPSSYSFDQTAGISIIKYVGNLTSGAKLAHGLGVTPTFVIVKMLNAVKDWLVYSKGMDATAPEDYGISLNTTAARVDETTFWNDTAPDSVNFTLGNTVKVNGSGDDYIAYCFAEKQGYSSMGLYKGNGNALGAFVYTGFRPAFILIKRSDASTENWNVYDNKRLGYNVDNDALNPNVATTGYTTDDIDIVSNGFKLRTSNSRVNDGDYIYMAFAEAPLVNSEGVPVNAR